MMRITAPTYTQTPNELFDQWLPHLSEAELKVLLVIMRKTFGWHRTNDVISISQLAEKTGLLRETVIYAARSLQKKGVINRQVKGPKGMQLTTYSLVISEDSNSSYQSVEPTGGGSVEPTGGVVGLTDSQKKQITKETTTKERGVAAAVSLAKPKEEVKAKAVAPAPPPIYECLIPINIPQPDKIEITATYPEARVIHAIKWTQTTTSPIKCLAAALKWACKTQPRIDEPKQGFDANKAYAMQYDGEKTATAKVEACNTYVEVINAGQNGSKTFSYDDKDFMANFKSALKNNGFRIIEDYY